jgi:hypothetical protein
MQNSNIFSLELESDKTSKKWRDTSSHQITNEKNKTRDEVLLSAQHVSDFLVSFTCFELMPQSSKVVVLDINLTVGAAMHALNENSNFLKVQFNSILINIVRGEGGSFL